MRMNWRTSTNEIHKYFNEQKFALAENENTSALMDIAQEGDSIIFDLLKNCDKTIFNLSS